MIFGDLWALLFITWIYSFSNALLKLVENYLGRGVNKVGNIQESENKI